MYKENEKQKPRENMKYNTEGQWNRDKMTKRGWEKKMRTNMQKELPPQKKGNIQMVTKVKAKWKKAIWNDNKKDGDF